MSGQRLRLTTSRPAGYRRGGQVIGGAAAPAFIGPGDVTPEQMLAILRDPNIAIAIEIEEDVFRALTDEERAEIEERAEDAIELAPASGGEPHTAEPQGDGSASEGGNADAEASKAGGPDATADASAGSAADAGTTEPSQPAAADPAPVDSAPAAAAPASKGTGKPKTVKAKP